MFATRRTITKIIVKRKSKLKKHVDAPSLLDWLYYTTLFNELQQESFKFFEILCKKQLQYLQKQVTIYSEE